jgi:ATP-binding cassette subfamily C protein EexD
VTDASDDSANFERPVKRSLLWAAVFSLFINLLMLAPAFYMLQVYDRVITSGSTATLVMLSLILVLLLVALGGLEWVRSQILTRLGTRIEVLLDERLFDISFRQALYTGGTNTAGRLLSDVAGLRRFLSSNAPIALLDAPWLPVYLGVMYLFHPLFGLFGAVAAAVLLGLAWMSDRMTGQDAADSVQLSREAAESVHRNLRNAETIEAMGMLANIRGRWLRHQVAALAAHGRASRRGGSLAAVSRVLRLTVQSLVLGLGAWLVIGQQLTPGLMIAGAILLGRALAPVDQLIGSWRQLVQAREDYNRLRNMLERVPAENERMPLPAPTGALSVENLSVAAPATRNPILSDVSFAVEPGQLVGVIGASASGKTTLARAILGIWPPLAGSVRLDGAKLQDWDREALGRHVGYMPQTVELFDGSVAENIARFGELDADAVVAAARLAGVHDMILRLPKGYDTAVGQGGSVLSAGQRQRVALARAFYGAPKLVVLDEPNSNLDDSGEAALLAGLRELSRMGTTALVVSHRKTILAVVDRLVLLHQGRLVEAGPKEQVLETLNRKIASMQAHRARSRTAAPGDAGDD